MDTIHNSNPFIHVSDIHNSVDIPDVGVGHQEAQNVQGIIWRQIPQGQESYVPIPHLIISIDCQLKVSICY